ncbi:MAG TPA: hypothetical protein PKM50_09900 [Methanoregula sp.]|mgnify:CR=1 FL=1|nr:hypothetical protein [Methanoregula sp.]
MEGTSTSHENTATPEITASGIQYSNLISPCGTVAPVRCPAAGEIPPAIAEKPENVQEIQKRKPSHRTPYIFEALRILDRNGYDACRTVADPHLPQAIIATKGLDTLMIAVICSRRQVPDARTLHELYPENVIRACARAQTSPYRVMIWVTSPVSGWRYYRAYSGGIAYDWEFVKQIQS